ncbi:MAG: CRTAC1 family protein [Chloroflexota bacterium]
MTAEPHQFHQFIRGSSLCAVYRIACLIVSCLLISDCFQPIFAHLPNDELIEENQVYRNDGQGNLLPYPAWQLNGTLSGRSMGMANLDCDGDLDVVVNNLRKPSQIWENQLCAGKALVVDLAWMDSANPQAIGSTVTLTTSAGRQVGPVQATSGYLTGQSSQLHFGMTDDSTPQQIQIIWPNGATSTLLISGNVEKIIVERLP